MYSEKIFNRRLQKALAQNFKDKDSAIEWCKKECSKNYSDYKVHDFQCILEFLLYRIDHNVNISFNEYQIIEFQRMWNK